MRIVVNHLTRMAAPRLCVAGIDPATLEHVRPTTSPADRLTRSLLRAEGGPLSVGGVIDLGEGRREPGPPEIEDYRIRSSQLRRVGELSGPEYVELLAAVACPSFEDAFGPDLQRVGKWKFAVDSGNGDRSLGVIRARGQPHLQVDDKFGKPRLQLRLSSPDPPSYVGVTDIRFYDDGQSIRMDVVADAAQRLRAGVDAFLMLGLSRAIVMPNDDRERHWLQLNGICLADRPVGDQP